MNDRRETIDKELKEFEEKVNREKDDPAHILSSYKEEEHGEYLPFAALPLSKYRELCSGIWREMAEEKIKLARLEAEAAKQHIKVEELHKKFWDDVLAPIGLSHEQTVEDSVSLTLLADTPEENLLIMKIPPEVQERQALERLLGRPIDQPEE